MIKQQLPVLLQERNLPVMFHLRLDVANELRLLVEGIRESPVFLLPSEEIGKTPDTL
jgi:hypothetical protein